jgi:hypothetical protein
MLTPPIIAMLVITLGLPFLILLALVALTPAVSDSILTNVLFITVLSTFGILMVYEIKRVADQPPDEH